MPQTSAATRFFGSRLFGVFEHPRHFNVLALLAYSAQRGTGAGPGARLNRTRYPPVAMFAEIGAEPGAMPPPEVWKLTVW